MKKREKSWWASYRKRLDERQKLLRDNLLEQDERKKKNSSEQARRSRSSALYGRPSSLSGGGASTGGGVMRITPSGPRGRRFPKVAFSKPPRSVIIKSRYIPNNKVALKRLSGWLNYCSKEKDYGRDMGAEQLPPEKLREREFFSKTRDGISKEEAQELIQSNMGRRVAYHQMILSSGDREVDPQTYARHQMEALERRLGHKLTWVANVHRDTGPDKMHINVTIAGAIADFERPASVLPYKSNEIDVGRVPDEDKFLSADGQWYTKYHSQKELKAHSRWLRKEEERWIDEDSFKNKLWRWIGTKERYGDDCYGEPPLKDRDREQNAGNESAPQIDLAKVLPGDKIQFGDMTITKYDPLWKMHVLREHQKESQLNLGGTDTAKLTEWIAKKEEHGEQVFGEPPLRNPAEYEQVKPEKRLGIDLDRIPESEKVHVAGWTYTKFDSQESLKMLITQSKRDEEARISRDDYRKLLSWLNTKERSGDEIFGEPPMKELTKDERNELDKREIEFQFRLNRIDDITDRLAYELTEGKIISPQAVKFNRDLRRAAQTIEGQADQARLKTSWNNRGDVFIDRVSLEEMRNQGNYYVYMQRNFDRELERSIQLELGEHQRDREQDLTRDGKDSHGRELVDQSGAQEFKQGGPGISPDTVIGSDEHKKDADEQERKREDDDEQHRRR